MPRSQLFGGRARGTKFIIRHRYRSTRDMSPSTEDNLGRRRYLLERDKAVEEALEKVRRASDSEWGTLTSTDRAMLRAVIAEVWDASERSRWKQFCFSTLTRADILRLISLGDEIKTLHHLSDKTLAAAEAILLSCGLGHRAG